MKEREKIFQINGILVLVLFGIFAVSILVVLLTGAGVYKRLTERGQATYTERTITQYVTTRVRQADISGNVSVGSFHGMQTLELYETVGEHTYVTRIYCCDGYVRELFADASMEFMPSDGERLMKAEAVKFVLDGGFLTVEIVTQENEGTLTFALSLRSKEVAYEK